MPLHWSLALALVSLTSTAFAQVCDQRRDPHSFACSDAAFHGEVFPMIEMDGGARIQGRWALVTYADVSGREGPEFHMLVDPRNPRVPEGVVNRFDRSRAGDLHWFRDRGVFANFGAAGHELREEVGRTRLPDEFTAQIILSGARGTHALQCRIFERNRTEHLQCRWQTLSARENRFILRGYLGFLRAR